MNTPAAAATSKHPSLRTAYLTDAGSSEHPPSKQASILPRLLAHLRPACGDASSSPSAAAAPAPAALAAQRLAGQVCLVTGGASGIGKAICVQARPRTAHRHTTQCTLYMVIAASSADGGHAAGAGGRARGGLRPAAGAAGGRCECAG
jgi:hypothetical protein